jgi:ribosome biogenesis GTPase
VSNFLNDKKKLIEGIVVRAYGGYYYVRDEGLQEWVCSLRGRFRYKKQQVMVGDWVHLKPVRERTGVIEKILPRCTKLVRPPVANVDQVAAVFSVKDPEPYPVLLDRFLITAMMNKVDVLICFNKVDLEEAFDFKPLFLHYRKNYRVVTTSAVTGKGLDRLKEMLPGRVTVFAGPSGVGKSTILNQLIPGINLKTGDISVKIKKGKHTTRHVELIILPGGGLVADTPGFSSLELPDLEPQELAGYFPEMEMYQGNCRFAGCLHNKEPDCAVKEAVQSGRIEETRYRQYLDFMQELMDRRRY